MKQIGTTQTFGPVDTSGTPPLIATLTTVIDQAVAVVLHADGFDTIGAKSLTVFVGPTGQECSYNAPGLASTDFVAGILPGGGPKAACTQFVMPAVASGTKIQVFLGGSGSDTAVSGSVDFYAVDTQSALNVAYPSSITASSPLYDINLLGGGQVTYSGPVASDDTVTVYRSDNYDGANILQWTVEDYSGYDLTGATLKFRAQRKADYNRDSVTAAIESTCTHTVAGTTITIEAAPTISSLSTSPPGAAENYRYQIIATTNATPAKTQTVVDGELKVSKSIGNTSGT